MGIPARSAILRMASGGDLVTDWFSGAAQPQKNMVSSILFAIAESTVCARFTVVDDAADHMAFFVLTGGGIAVKARISGCDSFDVLYIGSSCDAPGLDRPAVKSSPPSHDEIMLLCPRCHCGTGFSGSIDKSAGSYLASILSEHSGKLTSGAFRMAAADLPGLDVSSRVRARDIQMAGIADVRRRVLMISGAIDTTDHDISLCVNLPEPGRWQVIKSMSNLTAQTWVAIQVITDEESSIVSDQDTAILSRQFAKTFMTPDHRRLMFYDGEVRPGESLLKLYSLETMARRPSYAYSQYSPVTADSMEESGAKLQRMLTDGLPTRPVIELIVPVTVIG